MSDDKLIEQARLRKVHGHDNELDRHRLRAAERREQLGTKEMPLDGNLLVVRKVTFNANGDAEYTIKPEIAQVLNEWWDEKLELAMGQDTVLDPIGYAIGESRNEMRKEFRREAETLAKKVAALLHEWMVREADYGNTIRRLENELSELRGHVKALTAERSRLWRPGE